VDLKVTEEPGQDTANILTGDFGINLDQPIELYDNTLREGEQTPGVMFTPAEKLEIARALDAYGVHWANVGFPAVSREELAAVAAVARAGLRMKIAALARMVASDIDATADAGVDLISLFLGGSDIHLRWKHHLTEAEAISRIESSVSHAKRTGALVSFSIEDGSRTPLHRIARMFQAAEQAGADYVVLADTVGVLTPDCTAKIVHLLTSLCTVRVGVHFHDDLGLALANTLAALEAGAQMVHVTVNGIGERSGNTCLEELAVVLKVKYERDLGLHLDQTAALSRLVHRAAGTEAPSHKPVTGRWTFSHEAGIHVAGLLANPATYQPYSPALVGRGHEVHFGKHSGAHCVEYAAQANGLQLGPAEAQRVVARIKSWSNSRKGPVPEEQVLDWIRVESSDGKTE
jgi:methanogen homocitrate synthase